MAVESCNLLEREKSIYFCAKELNKRCAFNGEKPPTIFVEILAKNGKSKHLLKLRIKKYNLMNLWLEIIKVLILKSEHKN